MGKTSTGIDPAIFDEANAATETLAFNADLLATMSKLPDQWSIPAATVRKNRDAGLGPFPLEPKSERAEELEIDGPHGKVGLRIIAPENPSGAYLHIHGGGWVLGTNWHQDGRLEEIAANCGLATVSVGIPPCA